LFLCLTNDITILRKGNKKNTTKQGDHMARPLHTWKNKGIDIAAWPTNNGGVSFTIRKSYKPKDSNEYKETKILFPNDVAALIDLLKQAQDWAHKEFREPIPFVDTRPAHPKVEAIIKDMLDEDIPF
jgi:hypothetical protein